MGVLRGRRVRGVFKDKGRDRDSRDRVGLLGGLVLLGVGIFVGLLVLALMNREVVRFIIFVFFFFWLSVNCYQSDEPINNISR